MENVNYQLTNVEIDLNKEGRDYERIAVVHVNYSDVSLHEIQLHLHSFVGESLEKYCYKLNLEFSVVFDYDIKIVEEKICGIVDEVMGTYFRIVEFIENLIDESKNLVS